MKNRLMVAVAFVLGMFVFGSTMASACDVQIGRPGSCDGAYRRDWANGRYGRGGPWDPNGGGGYQQRSGYQHGGGYRQGVVVYGRQPTRRQVIVGGVVSGGAVGVYSRQPAPPAPVPSPAQIASSVPHKTTSVCVPCIDGYMQNPETCQCDRVTWRPGPPVQ